MISPNNNYISYKGTITFFNDRKPSPLPPPGGAVFRRPSGKAWASVPQIVGEYDEREPDVIEAD